MVSAAMTLADTRTTVSSGTAKTTCAIVLSKTKRRPPRLVATLTVILAARVTMFPHC